MDPDALLAWFEHARRDLPWRIEPRDPYHVWVSEAMLQQTRVDTVVGYYGAFLARFPTIAALAAAPADDVMKAWEGLGYYRRARLLHAGAKAVVEQHAGRLPADADALAALPGFGPYTVGAVGSLAFGLALPAVDGNVVRVASRILALEDDAASPAARRAVEAWVRAHQPAAHAGAFNEALMELGATVCTPRAPTCRACPVARDCLAQREGAPEAYPKKTRRAPSPEVRVALAIARRGDALLLERREAGLLAGTWGLPWVEVAEGEDARACLATHVAALTQAPVHVSAAVVRTGMHVFTHRKWRMEAFEVDAPGPGGTWRAPDEVALGTAHRRLLAP